MGLYEFVIHILEAGMNSCTYVDFNNEYFVHMCIESIEEVYFKS